VITPNCLGLIESGTVRAELILGGYVMAPSSLRETMVTYVVQSDLKGNLYFRRLLFHVCVLNALRVSLFDVVYRVELKISHLPGSLPTSVVNLVSGTQPLIVFAIRKVLTEQFIKKGEVSRWAGKPFTNQGTATFACRILIIL
jgi:hypothetical protein